MTDFIFDCMYIAVQATIGSIAISLAFVGLMAAFAEIGWMIPKGKSK